MMEERSNKKKQEKHDDVSILDIKKYFDHNRNMTQPKGFDKEFFHIEKESKKSKYYKPCYDAVSQENLDKNRYSNVLPNDDTRIILKEPPNYINANLIITSHGHRYIASQGPMSNTIYDFWRMIWEQNCKTIVMLTKEYENGRVKCSKYWPDEDILTFNDISITFNHKKVQFSKNVEDIIKTSLTISKSSCDEKREIYHYQHVGWPDHDLPICRKSFLKMIEEVKQDIEDGPIVVHCSAGIGRTGTFCTVHTTVHNMKQYLLKHKKMPLINIYNTVLELRKQRAGMVQTKDQYLFCYRAVLKYYESFKRKRKTKN